MHIPDGFLDPKTLAITDGIAGIILVSAGRKLKGRVTPSLVSIMGLSTAFVFAVNMFAFPVAGGTSAHLTGATLVSVIAGPVEGLFSVFFALLLQGFLFHHGGILSLGANFINIGVTGSLAGYLTILLNRNPVVGGITSALSILVGSALCSLELWLSGRGALTRGLIAMEVANLIPAILDGVVTAGVILLLADKIEKWKMDIDGTQSS